MRTIGVERDVLMKALQEDMQESQALAADGGCDIPGIGGNRLVGGGQLGFAQEERRRKPFHRAGDNPVGVPRIDFALHSHGQFVKRPVGRE